MARAFEQHADAGKFHLEIRYAAGNEKPWEWFALDAKQTSKTIFSGKCMTLKSAKNDAAKSAGLKEAKWRPIGSALDVPDESLG